MKQERSADRRKHHIIYKTTCLVTGRWYVGMHSTDNLADRYIGSGKRLWRSIKKHGVEQHKCEILEHLPDRKTLRDREIQLVNKELINDPMCMNIALGGDGSWEHLNSVEKCQERARKMNDTLWSNHEWVAKHKAASSERFKELGAAGKLNRSPPTFAGQKHSEETRQRMAESARKRVAANNGKVIVRR